jgi:isopentenyl diphosphate isomerase/L-lactate dehydrogenase-like FMN-dependent dehydrogenase
MEETVRVIEEIRDEIQICMFAAGAADLQALAATPLVDINGR